METSLSKFDIICQNYGLTDYFKTLSDEELIQIMNHIVTDDIIGTREKIYEVIKIELQYRESEKLLNKNNLGKQK